MPATRVVVLRKFNPVSDTVAAPEDFFTPKSKWVVGLVVGPNYGVPSVWESVEAAQRMAASEGAVFVDARRNGGAL